MRLGQTHDAQAGAETLLGVAAVAQDDLDQRRRVGAHLRGPGLQPLGRPFGVAPFAIGLEPMAPSMAHLAGM